LIPGVAVVLAGFTLVGCGNGDDSTPVVTVPEAGPDGSGIQADASTTEAGPDATMSGSDAGDAGDAASTAALVARGDYLVNAVASCGDCHTPRTQTGAPDTTKTLAGSPGEFEVPGLGPDGGVGIVSPPNLTPDMTTGLGSWTDAQIKNAILNGVDSDGKALFPIMPYFVFHNMTSDDADAIVAYLRTLPAVSNAIPERNFDFAQPAMPVPATDIPEPVVDGADASADAGALAASAERGKYLAGNVGVCMECHTTHVQGPVPLDVTKLFAGGDVFPAAELNLPAPPFPSNIVSANITPSSTGIQGWTATQVVAALRQGLDISGAPLCPPMPFGPNGAFGHLTDGDALDIANYVTHLPPIANTISPICHAVLAQNTADAGAGDAGAADASDATPE
jgi:mono/diheme cytochrome c family protein